MERQTSTPNACLHRVRKSPWGFSRLRWKLYLIRKRLLNTMSIWSGASRSFRGHIQIQSSKELPSVGLGSELVRSHAGDLRVNTRSLARSIYTQKLLAIYPWADIVDLRIFLMGFDSGEQWTSHSPYTEGGKQIARSWLDLMEKESGSVLDEVNDAIKAYNHCGMIFP